MYSADARCAGTDADSYLKLTDKGTTPDGVHNYESNDRSLNGVTRFNCETSSPDTVVYGRGYMILKNSAGEFLHVYTDAIASGSYNGLN